MAQTNKQKTQKTQQSEDARPWTKVLKNVAVRVFDDQSYVLVALSEDQQSELEEESPVDIEFRDGVMLLNISRFVRFAIGDNVLDQAEVAGKGWANIKIKHSEYDYNFKGKRGHTSKLELTGCRFKSHEVVDALSDLDDDDPVPAGDLPF